MTRTIKLWLFLIVCFSGPLSAQEVFPGAGLGSYRLDFPGWNYTHDIYAPIGDNLTSHIKKGPNYTGPLQTHQWWGSALFDYGNIVVNEAAKTITDLGYQKHSNAMYPYPMILQAEDAGYTLRYGTSDINGLSTEIEIHSAVIDTRVGLQGQTATQTMVDGYGDWHSVLYQDYGSGNTLRMTGSAGCPFAFFQRTGTINPTIYGLGKNIITKSTSGNSFIFSVAPEGRVINFAVFFPAGTQMGNNGAPYTNITAVPLGTFGCCWDNMVFNMPAGKNYFSVAIMSNTTQATLDMYESRAFNFITGTTHTYNFNETTSKLTTTFSATTTNVYGGVNNGTLQSLYKHQYRYSPEAAGAANTGLTYVSPRGTMQVLSTNVFTTVMTHQGILPNLGWANTYTKTQMKAYIDNWLPTVVIPQSPADGYNKDGFVELANCAQIASQIGYVTAKNKCLDAMQQRLTNWFTSPVTEDWAIFVYNNNFNWLAHYPNGFTSSGQFIDMHFHMGYLIYGAAILARERPAWAAQYGGMVETMIRQVNDYRKDATNPPGNIGWFPYLRHFDPYAGHSWASPDNGGQESVSEALLFASGTFLWGETVGNNNLRSLGALLYITESEAAKLYWFDVDQNINYNWQGGTYPQYQATILRAGGESYATYFSADERWRYTINLLPQTAGSLWQVWNPTAAQTIFSHFPAGGFPAWGNHGYHYDYVQAGFNATASVNAFNTYAVSQQWIDPTFPHVNGNIPELYQWVHTFDSVGVYDNTVQADITGFSVFKKGTCKYYMVYMPPGKGPKVVNFTDGQSFNVPNDTVITYRVCTPLPVSWLGFTAKNISNEYVSLNWSTASEKDNDFFEVQRSIDGSTWETIGRVNGNGNSSIQNNYPFHDISPRYGINYYRLKQVDTDGKFDYSKQVSVLFNLGNSAALNIYPNPATEIIIIKSSLGDIADYELVFKDILGRTCNVEQLRQNGIDSKTFDLTSLSTGIYLVEATHQVSGKKIILKIIKE